jgi:hypothetical protein
MHQKINQHGAIDYNVFASQVGDYVLLLMQEAKAEG